MKHLTHSITLFFLLVTALFLGSCSHMDFSESTEDTPDSKLSSVRIVTRAASAGENLYPLRIYAFKDDGQLKAMQTINSETEPIRLMLPVGSDMRIVALTANESTYSIPNTPTTSTLITPYAPTLPEDCPTHIRDLAKGYVTSHPLQMGFADICPSAANATLSMQMYYQMCSMRVTLSGLPEDCASAYISIASAANSITMAGELAGSQKTSIPLVYTPATGLWASGEVFLFPTTGSQTNFTIAYDDHQGEHFAIVSYMAPLKAGTPYVLQGTLSEGNLLVSGSIYSSRWGEPVNMDFAFSPDSSTILSPDGEPMGDNDDDENLPTYTVDKLPNAISLWNGHAVIDVTMDESSSTSAKVMLLSLDEYENITSAYNAETPSQAADIAAGYKEYELEGWKIPSAEEARKLREVYLSNSTSIEAMLSQANASPICITDSKDNNVRYLCNEARSTYSFKPGTSYNSIKEAGAKVDTYHLRLIKTVRLTANN